MFARTQREVPAEAELSSHQLLVRGGYVRQLASGIFTQLPLGYRVIKKLEKIMREEMDRIDGQEMLMPVVHPAELWQETKRWYVIGPELIRFKDRADRDMVIAMTHEEVVADIARKEIVSYRQLPQLVYHLQTKLRDEPRPRGGLIRVREFTMKDAYSLHTSFDDLDRFYPVISDAYVRIFERAGLAAVRIEADNGIMGGRESHEFVLLADSGENTIVHCVRGDYAANLETARCAAPNVEAGAPLELEEVATPHAATIEAVATLLAVPKTQTLKSMLYVVNDEVVMVVLRGDRMVNDFKLPRAFGTNMFRPALAAELRAAGAVEGFASPLGLTTIRVLADESVRWGNNFVVGANKEGYHARNANLDRDLHIDRFYDLSNVEPGDRCPVCGGALQFTRGIEVGHIFKLGTRFSEALHAYYLDKDGVAKPIVMGSYGIGSGRLMAAAVEQHHDEKGICWPMPIAPFHIHLVGLGLGDAAIKARAEQMYLELREAGFEVLFDDRDDAQAGVKFNDADLIGLPIRLTLSPRSLKAGGVELKLRRAPDVHVVELDALHAELKRLIEAEGTA
jgi:prolyl-tRNA synthetase